MDQAHPILFRVVCLTCVFCAIKNTQGQSGYKVQDCLDIPVSGTLQLVGLSTIEKWTEPDIWPKI